jgi:hypothetical protein
MQVKGGKEVTLTPGQTFYEGPDDIHTPQCECDQARKVVVVLLKNKGAEALLPVE